MKSSVVKRSIVVGGHKTSVSLEDAFWRGLKEIAGRRDISVSDLVAAIDSERQHGNLSSAIRLFVLDTYRNQLSDLKAGHDATHEVAARAVAAFSYLGAEGTDAALAGSGEACPPDAARAGPAGSERRRRRAGHGADAQPGRGGPAVAGHEPDPGLRGRT